MIPLYTQLVITKFKGGKCPLWHARHKDAYLPGTGPHNIVGAGNSADNAIKDWFKQRRQWKEVTV